MIIQSSHLAPSVTESQITSPMQPILQVEGLNINYPLKKGWFSKGKCLHAVNNISFNVFPKEILGIVGESGCGKSSLIKAIARILPKNVEQKGKIVFNGEDITQYNPKQLRQLGP